MKHPQSKLLSATLLMMMLVFSVSVPVSAMESASTIDDTPSETMTAQAKKDEAHSKAAEANKQQQEARDQVKLAKAEARNDGKPGRSAEQKQKICDARKKSISIHVKRLDTSAQKAQQRIDNILAKAEKYQSSKNVQLSNYDSLLAAAKAAQATSAASVSALNQATPTIDCSNGHAGDDVVAFRAKAKQAHADLKTYRKSVKALLQALHQAAPKTEGGQQ